MALYDKLDWTQKRAVRLLVAKKSAAVFFEQGVGKTHPALACAELLAEEDKDFVGFIVVRLSNIETTWIKLISTELPWINFSSDWKEFKALPSPKLFVIHYEGMPKVRKQLTKFKWTFGAFDESQGLKARGSAQSRTAGLIRDCEYRLILSGTPMDGEPMDYWGQFRFCAPQLFGNDRGAWKRFDEEYLKPTGYMGYQRKFRPEKLEQFMSIIAPYCIRVEAEDVLKLPPFTLELVPVSMLGEQEDLYKRMERHSVAHIQNKEAEARKMRMKAKTLQEEREYQQAKKLRKEAKRITAGLRITQMIKLQQICGGFVVDDDGDTHTLNSAKLRKLKFILKNKAKRPTVIFCKYREEHARIVELVESMGLRHGSIHGKVRDRKKKKLRTETLEAFQSGKLDVLVCQVRAGGVGVDLFKAQSAIIYSTTFSYIDYEQLRKRIHRRGQENPTTLFFIFIKLSIDEDIYKAILSKRSVNKSVFNQMKRRSLRNG